MPETPEKSNLEWHHPSEVMKLHKLKRKKKALQARIKKENNSQNISSNSKFDKVFSAEKRQNPFERNSDSKRVKIETSSILEESEDQTLFKILNHTTSTIPNQITSFSNLSFLKTQIDSKPVELVKAKGENWLPIDWSLKHKVRLLSQKPFPWNQKLKISEEASAVTAFTRCLDNNSETTLDISPNAKFYQCCLYWQQPSLPWLTLFPRSTNKAVTSNGGMLNTVIRESLQKAWSDSLRSLFQLIRTGQCPYFYACANNFTILFRAAGICGFCDVHAIITPTTRGFRKLLKQEDIEFTMPLKSKTETDSRAGTSEHGVEENEQDPMDDNWLKSLGVNDEDIKHISCIQERIEHKVECQSDNSEYSTVLIEGIEVQALYNFLINCKSTTALTGQFAYIPPTLLAPVAFHGSSLNSLKIRETKVHTDDEDYYSLELLGPILPTTIHNLFEISPPEHNMTLTFNTTKTTEPFSKLKTNERKSDLVKMGTAVFRKENLSDSGLLPKVVKHFCDPDKDYVTNIECLKYCNDSKTYTWT